VRGKVLGALWRGRVTSASLLVVWAVGLASGAVHPLGLLATAVVLGVAGLLSGAMGVAAALQPKEPPRPSAWARALGSSLGMIFLLIVLPVSLVPAALFTYEDVQAAARSGPFPPFNGTVLEAWAGARAVALACVAGIAALAARAIVGARSLDRTFDSLVGRPCRTLPGAAAPGEVSPLPLFASAPIEPVRAGHSMGT
jgi:hypothetical protein